MPPVLLMLFSVLAVVGLYNWYRSLWPDDPKGFWADVAGSLLIGAGAFAAVPLFLFVQWMHSAEQRYLWVIRGPEPFGSFGGGPYMMWLMAFFFFGGCAMVAAGIALRKYCRGRAPLIRRDR